MAWEQQHWSATRAKYDQSLLGATAVFLEEAWALLTSTFHVLKHDQVNIFG